MNMFMCIGKADSDIAALPYTSKTFTPTAMKPAAAPIAASPASDIPPNTDIGPAYPSLPAENKNFKATGRFWDKNV